MSRHLRRWGAVYILCLLFLGSWLGQALAMTPEIESEGWIKFWASTFENWQSEWLQLIFQAVLLLGAKHWLFQVDAKDMEQVQDKLDRILEKVGAPEKAGDEEWKEHDSD